MKIITTSIKDNLFFSEREIKEGNKPENYENSIVNVFDDVEYQTILGFGGAFTESSAYNYSQMSEENKKLFLESYFDKEKGIGYNFGRTHINSCDFSLKSYTYVDNDDKDLKTFDISHEKQYLIPLIKDAKKYINEELILFSSPWSPPAFMKDSSKMIEGGKLKKEYMSSWALYYCKYIKEMKKQGIEIWGLTIQNEPLATQPWESCPYSASDEATFAKEYLIPTLEKEGLGDIKVMIWDHNKERVYDRAKEILSDGYLNDKIFGVAYHWYSGEHFEGLKLVAEVLKKPVICSEFCCSYNMDPVEIAELYSKEMTENINNYMIASCDWNLLLNSYGGPYHNRTYRKEAPSMDPVNGCASPIMYNEKEDKLIFTPSYYYIGHFSKYVKRGAKHIATTKYASKIYATAFKNPNGEIVVVITNPNEKEKVVIRHNGICTEFEMPSHSISTIIL